MATADQREQAGFFNELFNDEDSDSDFEGFEIADLDTRADLDNTADDFMAN